MLLRIQQNCDLINRDEYQYDHMQQFPLTP